MTIAFICILIASLLPIIWIGIGKVLGGFSLKNNANPREVIAKTEKGILKRANWAQENSWESFAPFAAAVLIASFLGANQDQVDLFSMIFISMRVLHGAFYLANKPLARSIVWFAGMGCNFALYYLSWNL